MAQPASSDSDKNNILPGQFWEEVKESDKRFKLSSQVSTKIGDRAKIFALGPRKPEENGA
eukprot:3023967-Rhodomonas_salina.1